MIIIKKDLTRKIKQEHWKMIKKSNLNLFNNNLFRIIMFQFYADANNKTDVKDKMFDRFRQPDLFFYCYIDSKAIPLLSYYVQSTWDTVCLCFTLLTLKYMFYELLLFILMKSIITKYLYACT